jgi:hypothetical protein
LSEDAEKFKMNQELKDQSTNVQSSQKTAEKSDSRYCDSANVPAF